MKSIADTKLKLEEIELKYSLGHVSFIAYYSYKYILNWVLE